MKIPAPIQSLLKIATGWVPGLGTAVEEWLEHSNLQEERRSKLAALLDVDEKRWTPELAPAAVLRADYGVVPFHGRAAELASLAAWCDGEQRVAVRLFTAPGGFGKTRLLRHFVRVRRDAGWDGGFLREGELDDQGTEVLLDGGRKPLLLVLDYAESRSGEVERVVRAARASQRRVRVVLLARAEGDWWSELKRVGDGVGDFFQGPAVDAFQLRPLTDSAELRAASFDQAVQAFARLSGGSEPEVVVPPLEDEDFERVLLVHAAALAAVERERIAPGKLLDWLRERELGGIDRVCRQDAALGMEVARGVEQAAALVTLAQGADSRAEVLEIVSRVPSLADQPRVRRERIAEALHVLYGGRRWCDGVEPDLVGEHLVGASLRDAPELVEAAFGAEVPEARLETGLTVLNRLAQRSAEGRRLLEDAVGCALARAALPAVRVAAASGDPIGVVLAEALRRSGDSEVAQRLDGELPHSTVALRELAVEVERMLLYRLRVEDGDRADPERLARIAARANNLSIRLADLGRREEALDAILLAVRIQRGLADARPEIFRPALGTSLHSLEGRLSDLGRDEEALAAAREAVAIRRELADARPEVFRADLAGSLNNLANRLAAVGRREEALDATRESVETYRDLAIARADAFESFLALSLGTLSSRLWELGRRDEGLDAIREAVAIYRNLAIDRPDAFQPHLAACVHNLAVHFSGLGRRDEAVEAIREAVGVRRQLADARPGAFRPALADSLNNLSVCLSAIGGQEAALDASRESVLIYRDLAAARPAAFEPDLARSISILHDRLIEAEEIPDALRATSEALDVLEPYFRRHPAAFADLMDSIVIDCEQTAEVAGVEPDRERLAAIRDVLARVRDTS